MATPQFGNLEQQATQRINPLLRGLSMLTGGISGDLTGTNEQIRQQRSARRALLQEELQRRDDQRTLERQLMVSALQAGVGELEGNTLEEKMADLQRKRLQKEIIGEQGRIYGLGQTTGPSPYESDPAFRIGALRGQREIAEKEASAAVEEKIQRPGLEGQIRGFGGTPTAGAPTGELRGQLEKIRMETQSRIPLETRGSQAKAELSALQGLGAVPIPINVQSLTPEQAIAQADIYGRRYQQESYVGASEKKQRAERKAIDDFNAEAAQESPDSAKLKTMFYDLPADAQKDARNRQIAGVTQAPTPKERESIVKYREMLGKAQNLATSLYSLSGSENIAKVSQENFNGFKSWMRGLQNTYGTEDPRLQTINNIIQQFEQVVAGTRKDLFGASLTSGEQESAKQQFGDPKAANFLPRMVQFLDTVFSRDVLNDDYKAFGIQIPAQLEKSAQDARQKWLETRQKLNFGESSTSPRGRSQGRIQQLQSEASALRQALGMTNAPSTTR
jgi:hypothetical protein